MQSEVSRRICHSRLCKGIFFGTCQRYQQKVRTALDDNFCVYWFSYRNRCNKIGGGEASQVEFATMCAIENKWHFEPTRFDELSVYWKKNKLWGPNKGPFRHLGVKFVKMCIRPKDTTAKSLFEARCMKQNHDQGLDAVLHTRGGVMRLNGPVLVSSLKLDLSHCTLLPINFSIRSM